MLQVIFPEQRPDFGTLTELLAGLGELLSSFLLPVCISVWVSIQAEIISNLEFLALLED